MAKESKDAKYDEPELRERLKKKVQKGDKGGKPGQWSARKAQLLVHEYEKAGGGYTRPRSGSQEHLRQWTEQEWHATGPGGRYLPDVAWALLTAKERKATDSKKSKGKRQFVANTDAAKEARKAAELSSMKAPEARKAVGALDTASALRRAKRAESKHGKGRRSVLAAIEARRAEVS